MSQNISGLPNLNPNDQYQKQNQPNFSADGKAVPISTQGVVQNNPLLSAVSSQPENPLKFLAAAGVSTAGLMTINNYINNSLLTKKYDSTIFKKIETFVDKYASKPVPKNILNKLKTVKDWIKTQAGKSRIIETLVKKPSIGGPMVQSQAAGAKGHLANRAIEIIKKYCNEFGLEQYNSVLSKCKDKKYTDVNSILKNLQKIKAQNPSFTYFDSCIQQITNGSLNQVDDIYNALKANKLTVFPKSVLNFDKILNKAGNESYKYYDEIIKTIRNSGADLTKVISKKPWWGFGIVKNKLSLREILNKDILIQNYKAGGKTLGQKVSGYLMRSTEALTNGLFSGKGTVLIQALMIAQSMNEASKAEKGEKFSTFMASFSELMAFMATMGIQMRVVNGIGGLKYLGMTPEQVKNYQKAMKIANKAAGIGNKAVHTKMVNYMNNLKTLAKANVKWYQKPLKWLGDLVTIGRIKETLKPLKGSKIATAWAKVPYGLKVGLGYAGRIALIMGVIIPIFSGIAKKISYAIFGKPVKTLEREKQKEEIEKTGQQTTPQEQPQQPQQVQQPVQGPVPHGDLVDKMNNPQQYQQQPQPQPQQQAIPAQSMTQHISSTPVNKTPEQNAGITRNYIPNPVLGAENPINPSATRSAAIDAALRKADLAESQARKFL